MKKIFFTPGPSHLYSTLSRHIKTALTEDVLSISHRGEKFHLLLENLQNNLRVLLDIPKDHQIFFISSGTEAMEVTIRNCVQKNSFHLINGAFSQRFFEISQALNKEAQATMITELSEVKDLKVNSQTELICITQNETSTGYQVPIEFIYKIKNKYPNCLLALDTVSSMPYVDLNYSLTDVVFFSVQKCFGLPSGLGVMIVSPQAIDKARYLLENNYDVGVIHNFTKLSKAMQKLETVETPNIFALYLMEKVTNDFLQIGINNLRQETEVKAKLLYDFFDNQAGFDISIKDKRYQSQTVIVINAETNKLNGIKEIELRNNIVIGRGYGIYKDKQLRVANFFTHSIADVERLLRLIKS